MKIYLKIDGKDTFLGVEDYLKMIVNYHWLDIVRLSIQYNISIKRMIIKLMESGGLLNVGKVGIDIVVKFIDNKFWEMRDAA